MEYALAEIDRILKTCFESDMGWRDKQYLLNKTLKIIDKYNQLENYKEEK